MLLSIVVGLMSNYVMYQKFIYLYIFLIMCFILCISIEFCVYFWGMFLIIIFDAISFSNAIIMSPIGIINLPQIYSAVFNTY